MAKGKASVAVAAKVAADRTSFGLRELMLAEAQANAHVIRASFLPQYPAFPGDSRSRDNA